MNKSNKNKNRSYSIILVILFLLIVISGGAVIKNYLENKQAEEEYQRLAELARQTTEATTEATTDAVTEASTPEETQPETQAFVSPINFEELRKINPDIIGWIRIPDTNVDYPIVQTTDNDKYLHTSFEGDQNIAGAIYLDFESDGGLRGLNNVIYGHNMKNGSMFKDVVRYKDQNFFNEHQNLEIYTPNETIRLKAISSYYKKAEPIVRKTRFKSRESYTAFLQEMLAPCSWAEIPQVPVDSLYTLVTCSYEVDDARTFLFAVEVDENGNIIEGGKTINGSNVANSN